MDLLALSSSPVPCPWAQELDLSSAQNLRLCLAVLGQCWAPVQPQWCLVDCFPGSVSPLHHCSGPAGAPGPDPSPDGQSDFLAWPGTCPITDVASFSVLLVGPGYHIWVPAAPFSSPTSGFGHRHKDLAWPGLQMKLWGNDELLSPGL